MTRRTVPRYTEIERALRAQIASLAVGDPLPSDTALSLEFDVSRMTVRQAFQALVNEGLVERRPGSGTFVADSSPHRQATVVVGFSDEVRRRGQEPSSRVLDAALRPASDTEAVVFGLDEGEQVVCLDRIRMADGTPIAIERAVVHGRCKAVLDYDLATGSLHAAMRNEGIVPARGRATLLADRVGRDEADLLDVVEGDALLVERLLIYDDRDEPLELTESRYVASRYELDVEFVVTG